MPLKPRRDQPDLLHCPEQQVAFEEELRQASIAVANLREHAMAGHRCTHRQLWQIDRLVTDLAQCYVMLESEYAAWQSETGLRRPCQATTTTIQEDDK